MDGDAPYPHSPLFRSGSREDSRVNCCHVVSQQSRIPLAEVDPRRLSCQRWSTRAQGRGSSGDLGPRPRRALLAVQVDRRHTSRSCFTIGWGLEQPGLPSASGPPRQTRTFEGISDDHFRRAPPARAQTSAKTASGHTNGSTQQPPSYPLVLRRLDPVPPPPECGRARSDDAPAR